MDLVETDVSNGVLMEIVLQNLSIGSLDNVPQN